MKKSEINELMWEYLFEVVEEHLESGEPAALTQTFNRLIREGYAPREAKRLVGFVVLRELMRVSNIKGFSEEHPTLYDDRFVERLNQLPEVPPEMIDD